MIPEDKFGRPIYPSTFAKIQGIAKKLQSLGYTESRENPNLFYLKSGDLTFYADFRGTEEVSIWDEPIPLVYWFPTIEDEAAMLAVLHHFEVLGENCIPKRTSSVDISEPGGQLWEMSDFIDNYLINSFGIPRFLIEGGEFSFIDQEGRCHECKKLFHAPGFFCSDSCMMKFTTRTVAKMVNYSQVFCEVCRMEILDDYLIEPAREYLGIIAESDKQDGRARIQVHHISYFPENKILVCRKCHTKIHHTDNYPDLKPPIGDSKKFYKGGIDGVMLNSTMPLFFCGWCGHNWKARIEFPIKCPKCRSEYITSASSGIRCPHCKEVYPSRKDWLDHIQRVRMVRKNTLRKKERRDKVRASEFDTAVTRRLGLR